MKKIKYLFVVFLATKIFAGDVTGKINFTGAASKQIPIRMDADKVCKGSHSSAVYSPEVVVNTNKTLKNVFVSIKSGLDKKYPAPSSPFVLDQKGCEYSPHVFGIMVGQEIIIQNSDATLHNVHGLGKSNPQFNTAQPLKGMKLKKKFEKEEKMMKIKCEVHNWMSTYAGVVSNPFFDVSDADGNFTLKDVPAGNYVIEAWHEKFGVQELKVTVSNKPTTANFTFAGK